MILSSNPLPPAPPIPPIGPDRFPVTSDITLYVQKPYGQTLPYGPTVLCLSEAENDLDDQYSRKGDAIIDYTYTFKNRGIKAFIQSLDRRNMVLSKASAVLRGIKELMINYPELGTRAVLVLASEIDHGLIARVIISRDEVGVNGNLTTSLNGTIPNLDSGNLSALDPTNYRVPYTTTTVALEGQPPYGSPLDQDALTFALVMAQDSAAKTIYRIGDDVLPTLWRFEEGSIGIDVYTDLRVDCHFSTLLNGILGLVDIIQEPGGVGAVAADFIFKEDGKGEVASGRLKSLGSYGTAAADVTTIPNVTLVAQGKTASVTLIGGSEATGSVRTA